ncbi:chemotaxis protein CheR [Sphingomonas sp. Leaf17]|uniref:CheR family methyltransferase n=1 Tax=Sphingomonas sp. Leaf17 TaxID=1735683 RepID=UPI0006FA6B68|nr:protein-glutamate O-methyltransferase CheR [Sphingomonas sp. Leaf17]KQM67414.1 chemotaxis protein CheR [Sphingomonas sp. Leaf17]
MSAAPAARAFDVPPARAAEFAFEHRDHVAIAEIVYADSGILLPDGKMQLVYGRLAKRLRIRGLTRFSEYVALLGTDPAERIEAIDALTTNHTKFFREDHHFDHFRDTVWPGLTRRLETGGRVRMWSAACSSGEEPYTLAMTMLGRDKANATRLGRQDCQILATDLSPTILDQARAGTYPASVSQGVPADLRNLWLVRRGDLVEVHPACKALVAYRPLNLLRDWPMKQMFDVIFCRNVMIYFDEPTKATLQARLADQLAPGGHLYIGHSERLSPSVAPRFESIGRTMYRKLGA